MLPDPLADVLPSLPAAYDPPEPHRVRRCPACLADLMVTRHELGCSREPRLDDVMNLAMSPAEARVENTLVRCHRRAVKAWLKSGRTL